MPQCRQVPVLPNSSFFSQEGVNYRLQSYLSLSNEYATIDRSVRFENHDYHLISLHNSDSQFYLLTAIKIASYFTIILPLLAMIMVNITAGKNHYYDSKCYIHDFKDMLLHHPKEARVLTLLDPLVLYKARPSGQSTLVEIFTKGSPAERQAISQLIKNDPGNVLTKKDKEELFNIRIGFTGHHYMNTRIRQYVFDDTHLDVIKALNIATQGALHRNLTKNDLNTLLYENYDLWAYLTLKTNPFPVNPELVEVNLDYFYNHLKCPGIHKQKLTDLYAADPTVLTREDSMHRTVFIKLLEDYKYSLKESVDWILKTDLKSILTTNNTRCLFAEASKPYSSAGDFIEINHLIKTLNMSTKGAIHKNLSKYDVDEIYKNNRSLWFYLTSDSDNLYPINPDLYTPPASSSYSYTSGSSSSSTHNTFNDSSYSRFHPFFSSSSSSSDRSRTPPPRERSSSTPTYEDCLDTLYKLSGANKARNPITKSSIKKIYIGAIPKLHPDKHQNTPESIEKMQEFNAAYTNIQETKQYKNLPN